MKESNLTKHIANITSLSEKEATEIIDFFDYQSYKKKEKLQLSENPCYKLFFVSEGCLQLYFIDDLGNTKTTQFAIENWWITDFLAFQNQNHSEFFIEAVENSKVFSITFSNYQELLEKHPKMEKYFRTIYETAFGSALMRFKYIYSFSKEDIFFEFQTQFPEFVQRVPQYLLASFLGLTPEYLSEIKRKKLS
ncbi:Crp/Fnr family transcriptional regulator [Mangrovimonas aestuarii]|uniref:Crp/Fnr family transcriptional regulator n=1 Tax=Mangrovimonas aestuarii TaxID=3018443 RepID=UPI002378C53B|nr:Crp/Fnr family transcriptional regulator [Mangrovimonas aestuarii]